NTNPAIFEREKGENSQDLPLYTYVPGLTPHPASVPHSTRSPGELLEQGRRLFDRGFYWEAHEAWEEAWIAAGRAGPKADFLKALIKLAACGVKCLEQNRRGAVRHATRAIDLLQAVSPCIRDRLPESSL